MALNEELNTARKKLFEKLGENMSQYCYLMKMWFTMKITKEEFDAEVRRSMTSEQMHLHNEFLIMLFRKCNFTSELSRNRIAKRAKLAKQKRTADRNIFQANDAVNCFPQLETQPHHLQEESTLRFSAQELFLPNQAFIQGRLMLASWEQGMDGAEDAAADLLVIAVQYFLKNILTIIFAHRSGYRLRDNRIMYGLGSSVPNPWLRNHPRENYLIKEKETLDESESNYTEIDADILNDDIKIPLGLESKEEISREKIYRQACSAGNLVSVRKMPVTAYDVLQSLLAQKSCVPAHSVYAVNLEKIICSLYHPSHEEIEAMPYV